MDTSIAGKLFKISSGPNRDTIFDACKYAYDKNVVIPLEFGVTGEYYPLPNESTSLTLIVMQNVHVRSVEHEDGSGHSFMLRGWCEVITPKASWRTRHFRAYYNAKNRTGHIEFD